jgi:serine phosphatase RsbU (regulator of sigma subunit)
MPLEAPLAAALSREVGIPIRFVDARQSHDGGNLDIDSPKKERAAPAPSSAAPPPRGRGFLRSRWIWWIGAAPFDVVDGASGAKKETSRAILVVQASFAEEFGRLFAVGEVVNREGLSTANAVLVIMKVLAGVVVAVYLCASLLSALLVMRIARATGRLSLGMAAVERGDFSYRARLSGNDQLASLVNGFNEMAAHLSAAVTARAERETLEHELEMARSLQRRLLPPADFAFPGLEIVSDFRPAAAIGGDFYHLLPESDTRLSVVIADVSGHGLPTGIVMASAKASLSALAATGMDAPTLLAHLDSEIRQSTESRTFVTLGHLRFDLAARSVAYTNAGHVYPWVVRASGAVSSVANPARPLGVGLPAEFRTVTAPLEKGDLWVLVSDGIVEAHSKEGEPLGFPRLEELVAKGAGGTAADLAAGILNAWRAHTGTDEPEDDRTLIVLKVL